MLQLDDITIYAEDQQTKIFSSLSFTIKAGEYFCIRSGSQDGASTLLKTLAGLKESNSGSCRFNDKPILEYTDKEIFQEICMCHEHNGLVSFFTNRQNIIYPVRYHELMTEDLLNERLSHYAEQLGIAELLDLEPWQLNDVQYRLMNVLRALVIEPSVILLDEFQSGMSDDMVAKLTKFLKNLCTTSNLAIVEVVTAGDETNHADQIYQINDNTLELEP